MNIYKKNYWQKLYCLFTVLFHNLLSFFLRKLPNFILAKTIFLYKELNTGYIQLKYDLCNSFHHLSFTFCTDMKQEDYIELLGLLLTLSTSRINFFFNITFQYTETDKKINLKEIIILTNVLQMVYKGLN